MVLAKGSKVVFSDKYWGALSEDYTVSLTSEFEDLASGIVNDDVMKAGNIIGAAVKSIFGFGGSFHFKQLGTQIWKSTQPAEISIGVTFDRISNAETDIMDAVKYFCAFPLPAENSIGNLTPPGPSFIEGIGLDDILNRYREPKAGDTYVNFTIGNMKFYRYLMTHAEPTFNKFSDDSGYPISATIAFTFISMWTATKNIPYGWA
jgi:hypothetical protein